MTDSWTITEQSQTGEVQYTIAKYNQTITSGLTTTNFNVAGYTSGTVATNGVGTTALLLLEGSNDGLSWFGLASTKTLDATGLLINFIGWTRAVREIRLTGSVANITDVYIIAIAGGSGILDSNAGSTYAPGSNKEIIFNDNGGFAGTVGALYDKTANPTGPEPTGTGQIQLAAGSSEEPMLAFADNTGKYNTGIYKDGTDRVGMSSGHSGSSGTTIAVISKDNVTPYAAGLNIVNTSSIPAPGLGIIKISADGTDKSWEDGFFGNSARMFFTCNDFSIVTTLAQSIPLPYGCGINSSVRPVNLPGPVFLINNGGGIMTSVKLIPKGFYIPEDSLLTIQVNDGFTLFGSTAGNPCTVHVLSYKITTPTVSTISHSAVTSLTLWGASGTNIQTSITPAIEGDGDTLVVISIEVPSNFPANPAAALDTGLCWASFTLARLPIP